MAKKILVVDDEPEIVELLKTRLEVSGYQVVTAGNGVTALRTVKEERPDLLILDMMLPDIQGSTICAQIKADEKYSFIPVILLTARSSDYDKDVVRTIKADAYITKPFKQEVLLKTVKDLLRLP